MVWVYISSRSLDGGFLLWADQHRTAEAVPVRLGWAPVDGICIHCGEHTTDGSLHGVFGVAAGAAGVDVVGATVAGLTAWVAGAGACIAGATSLMAVVSSLTASW